MKKLIISLAIILLTSCVEKEIGHVYFSVKSVSSTEKEILVNGNSVDVYNMAITDEMGNLTSSVYRPDCDIYYGDVVTFKATSKKLKDVQVFVLDVEFNVIKKGNKGTTSKVTAIAK